MKQKKTLCGVNISRKLKIIYEPKGKALEYSELAANLYRGCDHGCKYCYAPRVLHMKNQEFFNKPKPRKNVIELFKLDCEQLAKQNETRPILLCFTCDAYQNINEMYNITRKAIRILVDNDLKFKILTKGGKRSTVDFDIIAEKPHLCEYGTTLVFNDRKSSEIERFAAPTSKRIQALKEAHELGLKTWVSLEPVWDCKETLNIIEKTSSFVDVFKIGKLNYDPHAKTIDWIKFREDVIKVCERLGAEYVLKNDLKNL